VDDACHGRVDGEEDTPAVRSHRCGSSGPGALPSAGDARRWRAETSDEHAHGPGRRGVMAGRHADRAGQSQSAGRVGSATQGRCMGGTKERGNPPTERLQVPLRPLHGSTSGSRSLRPRVTSFPPRPAAPDCSHGQLLDDHGRAGQPQRLPPRHLLPHRRDAGGRERGRGRDLAAAVLGGPRRDVRGVLLGHLRRDDQGGEVNLRGPGR
jgi:hypothetical protein